MRARLRVPLLISALLLALGGVLLNKRGHRPPPPAAPPRSTEVFLDDPTAKDGSFNLTPPRKPPLAEAGAYRKLGWRAAYGPALKKLAEERKGPSITAYPFLDQTRTGVGWQHTYGARFLVSGALALWTDANVAVGPEPDHFGIPKLGEMRDATPEAWAAAAAKDPSAAAADYLITGVYTDEPGQPGKQGEGASGKPVRLKIYAFDRFLKGIELFSGVATLPADYGWTGFDVIDEFVGGAARKLPELLSAAGIAHARDKAVSGAPAMGLELREVAFLLDSKDSWTIMDGIDRALIIAALNPGESAPLQAAAFGFDQLAEMYFDQGTFDHNALLYAARGRSLARLALLTNPAAAGAKGAWVLSLLPVAYPTVPHLGEALESDPVRNTPGIEELDKVLREVHSHPVPAERANRFADWVTLSVSSSERDFNGNAGNPDFEKARLGLWFDYDLFAQMLVNIKSFGNHTGAAGNRFDTFPEAAAVAMVTTAASEMAALGLALNPGKDRDEWAAEAARLSGVGAGKLTAAWTQGDYYEARLLFLNAFGNGSSLMAGPLFCNIVAATTTRLNKATRSALGWRAPSGFSGMEFAPAERAVFYHRREALGPKVLMTFASSLRGSLSELMSVGDEIRAADPALTAANEHYRECLFNQKDAQKTFSRMSELDRDLVDQFPISSTVYYGRGRLMMVQAGGAGPASEEGRQYVLEGSRIDPHWQNRMEKLGDLASRIGANRQAAEIYAELMRRLPERRDYGNTWAALKIGMGESSDPKIDAAYTATYTAWPGGARWWIAELRYLMDEKADFKAARELAARMPPFQPTYGPWWRADVESEDPAGDVAKGLEYVDQYEKAAKAAAKSNLALAAVESNVATLLMKFKKLDLAEPHVRAALALEPWKGDCIEVSASLAFEKGDYTLAISEWERSLQRYGEQPNLKIRISEALAKNGNLTQSKKVLEDLARPANPLYANVWAMAALVERAVEEKDAPGAAKLMDELGRSPMINAQAYRKALAAYEKLDATKAAALRARMPEIVRGPDINLLP